MTTEVQTPEKVYDGDGVSVAFAAPFRFLTGTLSVVIIGSDGSETTLVEDTQYSVTGGETDAGGTVTLTSGALAPTGTKVRIRRVTARKQTADYDTNDTFPAETHEAALDRLSLITQEQDILLSDVTERAVQVPFGENAMQLPSVTDRKEKALFFDNSGDATAISVDDFAEPARQQAEISTMSADLSQQSLLALYILAAGVIFEDGPTDPDFLSQPDGMVGFAKDSDGGISVYKRVGTGTELITSFPTSSTTVLKSMLAAASGSGSVGYQFPTANAQLRDVQRELVERGANVLGYYEATDADMTAAFQRAALDTTPTVDSPLNRFGGIFVPPGDQDYEISGPIVFDSSGQSHLTDQRISMYGLPGGARSSILSIAAGDFNAFTVIGSNGNGADAQVVIQDLNFDKEGHLGWNLAVLQYSHVRLSRIKTNGGYHGVFCKDVQESLFEDVMCTFGWVGMLVEAGDFTAPNAMTFLNCKMGGNFQGGLQVVNGAAVNVIGGSYESNKCADLTLPSFGIFAQWRSDLQVEGSVGLNVKGAYFEQNGQLGTATTDTGDIWIQNNAGPASHSIEGCTFQRLNNYCRNNIRLEATGGYQNTLTLNGNGHRHFPFGSGYTPVATRPYVDIVGRESVIVNHGTNYYHSDLERPDFTDRNNIMHGAMAQAHALFTGTGATGSTSPIAGMNVLQIVKTGTGAYEVWFRRPLRSYNYIVNFELPYDLRYDIVTKAADHVAFNIRNSSGTIVDATTVGIAIHGLGY